ncbi:Peptide transporter family 1 [Pseudolycoriella hygida]|uniref:Oligopeptide transporter 1 n=1 Tax=Pseudolycoriella hygida TaxID=35572 RepID=A0A9Q0RZF8_9DIPT|nr:Peptide transporter family 1 [Pseudolycoriella hygida]
MANNSDTNDKPNIQDVKDDGNADTAIAEATDPETSAKKYPYPKSIFFIISNEFCERFMYYGMRTVLVLYLTRKLFWDDDTATIIYHLFTTLVYFFSVLGAILSDSWLGKFKTILYLSIVYSCGSILMSFTAIPDWNIPGKEFTILALFLIALGSGGIKPCVAAFGGDQFKMPEQAKYMLTFFSIFYFTINLGSFISTLITPILRSDVKCFRDDDCYSLAFGVPGALMVTSIIIFVLGKTLYKVTAPSGNMLVKVSRCISHAISRKMKERKSNPKAHWLDYAVEKHGQQLVNETKVLLNVLVLYIPLPVFWSLFDQQGSRWTFQATRMMGFIGSYEIKPDQMQVVNPLLILVFIPLYDVLFYPLLSKIGVRRPLQKLTLGGILAGVAFLCSAIVELQLEKTYPVLPGNGISQLRLFNSAPCSYNVITDIPGESGSFVLEGLSASLEDERFAFTDRYVDVTERTNFAYTMTPTTVNAECPQFQGTFNLRSETAMSYFMSRQDQIYVFEDEPNKSRTGDPLLRILVNSANVLPLKVTDILHPDKLVRFDGNTTQRGLIQLVSSTYQIDIGSRNLEYKITQGAVNLLLLREASDGSFVSGNIVIAEPNTMHMLWLLPQYIIMTLGEVMYSVTGLAFSYAEAPVSMKSVLQSCWLLTVAFGNVIDIIIIGARGFSSQAHEFFLFAGLMFVDMVIFMILAYRYKSIPTADSQKTEQNDEPDGKKEGLDNVAFKND